VNQIPRSNSLRNGPDGRGRFGEFGGRFVAETLMPLILEVEQAYLAARADPAFKTELDAYLKNYVGRPSALWFAERLTRHLGGAKVYFKRDELNHTGSHKANNCMGQILLAKRMGLASSPRPAPASTAWRRQRCARCSGCRAPSTWAPPTSSGRSRMCSA
jgi:tryptophan synthase beta chain